MIDSRSMLILLCLTSDGSSSFPPSALSLWKLGGWSSLDGCSVAAASCDGGRTHARTHCCSAPGQASPHSPEPVSSTRATGEGGAPAGSRRAHVAARGSGGGARDLATSHQKDAERREPAPLRRLDPHSANDPERRSQLPVALPHPLHRPAEHPHLPEHAPPAPVPLEGAAEPLRVVVHDFDERRPAYGLEIDVRERHRP